MKTEWQSAFPAALAALCVALVRPACGQVSQFSFDLAGNLLTESSESGASPQIIGQPQMQVVIPGNNASFSVGVADTSGVSYQWFFNTTAIPGANADSLMLTNVSTANQGPYWVAVSNAVGSVASTLANLYLDSRGCGMPDSWQLQYFGNLNQSALGDYDGDGVSNLQEFLDGTDPTNAASALYHITLFYDGGAVAFSPDQPAYPNGQAVTLLATGNDATPFHAWTGDVVTRSNSITLTMNRDVTLFAHFLPFAMTWTNSFDGDWNVASNWTPNLVPGSNESVVIATGVTITQNSNVDLYDLTLGGVVAGTEPVLTGSGRITIADMGLWYAGTMNGSGATVVLPGASFSLIFDGYLNLGRVFENAGLTSLMSGAGSLTMIGGIITNDAGAQFALGNSVSLNFGGGVPRFDNAGTFVTAPNGTTVFEEVAFNNYGTVDIQGTLTMYGGGLQAGGIAVPAGATINFASGTFTSSGNNSITGAGTFMVSGGLGTLAGAINVAGSNLFSNGSMDFTGNYVCTNNTMVISGGTFSFDGTGLVAPAVLNLNGTLGGAQNVTVGSGMNWTGGGMSGTGRTLIPPGATLNINNPNTLSLTSRTLDNGGTAVWAGAGGIQLDAAVITNEPGALFQVQSPAFILFGGGTPRFDNAGTFNSTSSGVTTLGVALNNFNTVAIQAGTLALSGGGMNAGTISVPAGTTLNLASGTFTSTSNSSITGAGTLMVSANSGALAGTVNVSGSNLFSNGSMGFTGNYICTNNTMVISGGTFSFDGTGVVAPAVLSLNGTLGGAQNVTVGSAMTWTGGAMTGTGRTVIPSGSTLNLSSPNTLSLTSRTLDNGGTAVWTGAGDIQLDAAVITNRAGALFNAQTAASIFFGGGTPRFGNAGTFRKSVSTGTITIGGSVSFANYGTVDIQSGFLAANGGYVSSSNALLNCAIGGKTAGTNYGQLQVSGSVALNGTLSVNLTNNYIPTTNDSFTVMTAGTRNGTFSVFSYPSNQVTMQPSNTTTSVIVRVNAVAATPPPPPLLLPPTFSGTNVLLTWTTVSNVTYRLEFNPDLTPSNWNAIPGDVPGLSNTASKQDTLTMSNRFYRVQVLP